MRSSGPGVGQVGKKHVILNQVSDGGEGCGRTFCGENIFSLIFLCKTVCGPRYHHPTQKPSCPSSYLPRLSQASSLLQHQQWHLRDHLFNTNQAVINISSQKTNFTAGIQVVSGGCCHPQRSLSVLVVSLFPMTKAVSLCCFAFEH